MTREERRKQDVASRFVKKTRKGASGCVLWMGTKNQNGYGVVWAAGRLLRANRLSYELFVGGIPDGVCVLHRCDNPGCVNPTHLFLGTQADNVADMHQKGREGKAVGEMAGMSKLDEASVIQIRQQLNSGDPQSVVASRFNVNQKTISDIHRRETWKHVP